MRIGERFSFGHYAWLPPRDFVSQVASGETRPRNPLFTGGGAEQIVTPLTSQVTMADDGDPRTFSRRVLN